MKGAAPVITSLVCGWIICTEGTESGRTRQVQWGEFCPACFPHESLSFLRPLVYLIGQPGSVYKSPPSAHPEPYHYT
jgi:hypothetical protein